MKFEETEIGMKVLSSENTFYTYVITDKCEESNTVTVEVINTKLDGYGEIIPDKSLPFPEIDPEILSEGELKCK